MTKEPGEKTSLLSARYSSASSGSSANEHSPLQPIREESEEENGLIGKLRKFSRKIIQNRIEIPMRDVKEEQPVHHGPTLKIPHVNSPMNTSLQDKVHGLIIDLSYALGIYGIPSHRLEMHLKTLLDIFPFEKCQFRYTPSSLWFCFTPNFELDNDSDYRTGDGIITYAEESFLSKSKFYVVKLDDYDLEDMDLIKLCELDQLASEIPQYISLIDQTPEAVSDLIDDLRDRIRTIISRYSFLTTSIRIFLANIISSSMWVLYYDGSWMEMVCGFIVGIGMAVLGILAERFPSFNRINPFVSAIVAGTIGSLVKVVFSKALSEEYRGKYPFSVFLVTLCSLFGLLPQVSFTSGISEFATKNLVSGATRIFYAFVLILQMGFGIVVADKISYLFNISMLEENYFITNGQDDREELPLWLGCLVLPVIILGNYLDYKLPLIFKNPYAEQHYYREEDWCYSLSSFYYFIIRKIKSVHLMTFSFIVIVSYVVYAVTTVTDEYVGEEMSALLGAFMAGTLANIYAYLTNRPELVISINGLDLLVPSTYGVTGIAKFYDRDQSDELKSGIQFIADLLVIHLSLSIGLLLADLVAPKQKNKEGDLRVL